jgi:hypothetical protein
MTSYQYNQTENTALDSPLTLYLSQNATTASYFSVVSNGSTYLFDVSVPNQLGISYGNGNLALVNSSGIFLFGPGCGAALAIDIANFVQQVINYAEPSPSPTRRYAASWLEKRRETNFSAVLGLVNQCGGVTDYVPQVDVGDSPCAYAPPATGQLEWQCQYPGINSPETHCEATANSALSFLTTGWFGSLTNWGSAAGLIAKLIARGIVGEVAAAIAGFFLIEGVATALAALSIVQLAINAIGQDNIAYAICTALHFHEEIPMYVEISYTTIEAGQVTDAPDGGFFAGYYTYSDPSIPYCTPPVQATCDGLPMPDGCLSIASYRCVGLYDDCYCMTDVTGAPNCARDGYCGAGADCESNSNCEEGWVCQAAACCGADEPSVCVPLCDTNSG